MRQCGANATLGVPGTYTARFATGKWTQQMNVSLHLPLACCPQFESKLQSLLRGEIITLSVQELQSSSSALAKNAETELPTGLKPIWTHGQLTRRSSMFVKEARVWQSALRTSVLRVRSGLSSDF